MTPLEILSPTDPRYTLERFSALQAAGYLTISVDLLYRLIARGEISYRRGTQKHARIKFSQGDLDSWRNAQRHEATTGPVAKAQRFGRSAPAADVRPLPVIKNRRFA